jgi:MATE family multidrug resistance protein
MKRFFQTIHEIIFFSIPVILGEVSQVLFGIGDVLVAGRHSTLVLSALGIASAFIFPFIVFGLSLISVISSIKARRLGAKHSVHLIPATSLSIASIIGIAMTVLVLITSYSIVPLFSYPTETEILIQRYLYICAFSITPALTFASIKENLLARSHILVPNLIIFFFNFFNILANILLMLVLDFGIAGAAIATLISRSLMFIAIYIYSHKKFTWHWEICSSTFKEVLKLGTPTAFATLVVAMVFAIVALLVGKMSTTASATNNILINITSFTFMIPLAISNVAAVKIGHAFGANQLERIKHLLFAAITVALTFASIAAITFLLIPEQVIGLFTNQEEVISYGLGVLLFVAIYQIPDAIQAVLCGVLRGLGKTMAPVILGFISIWLIGLPIGCYLAYERGMEAAGLWAGLCTGLSSLSIMLTIYLILSYKRLRTA